MVTLLFSGADLSPFDHTQLLCKLLELNRPSLFWLGGWKAKRESSFYTQMSTFATRMIGIKFVSSSERRLWLAREKKYGEGNWLVRGTEYPVGFVTGLRMHVFDVIPNESLPFFPHRKKRERERGEYRDRGSGPFNKAQGLRIREGRFHPRLRELYEPRGPWRKIRNFHYSATVFCSILS